MAEEELKKALNVQADVKDPSPERLSGRPQALYSLSTLNGVIYEAVRKELRHPFNLKVYKQMLDDPDVRTPYRLLKSYITRPDWRVVAPKAASEEEHKRAKLINKSLHQMERPWAEYLSEMASSQIYGFWLGEKLAKNYKFKDGSFKGMGDIQTISQDTVEEWIIDLDTHKLKGIKQDLTRIYSDASNYSSTGYVAIPRLKFIHIRNDPERNNPEGTSVLDSCYISWKYKALLEEFMSIGVIKDLSGIPIFQVDAEVLAKAELDPAGPEATLLTQLQATGQALHQGDLSCGIIPIAYDNNNNKLYDFKLQGIEGGGKQYDPLEIVKYHSNKILMSFFADVLALGSDGSGSFALSDNKITLLTFYVESVLKSFKRTLDREFIAHIYAMNKWEYDPEVSARFEYDDIDDGNLEVLSKAIQQIFAVGAIRPSKETENFILDKFFDLPPYDDKTEFIETENSSRAGDGMGEGLPNGTGTSTSKGGNRSSANASKSNS